MVKYLNEETKEMRKQRKKKGSKQTIKQTKPLIKISLIMLVLYFPATGSERLGASSI